jgi:hypothetical protein
MINLIGQDPVSLGLILSHLTRSCLTVHHVRQVDRTSIGGDYDGGDTRVAYVLRLARSWFLAVRMYS